MGNINELQVKLNHINSVIFTLQNDFRTFSGNAVQMEQTVSIISALKAQLLLLQSEVDTLLYNNGSFHA